MAFGLVGGWYWYDRRHPATFTDKERMEWNKQVILNRDHEAEKYAYKDGSDSKLPRKNKDGFY